MQYLILIFLLLSHAAISDGGSTGILSLDDLTKYLEENHLEKEKLEAIQQFQYSGYMLKEEDVKKAIKLLPKMDKNIIDPFLQLILYLNHLSNGKEIRIPDEVSNKILDKFLYDPARFLRIFSFLRFHFKPQEDFFEAWHIELEKFLKKSDTLLSYCLTNNSNDLMQSFRQVPDYIFIYQKLKDGDDMLKLQILNFILSGDLKYSVDVEALKILAGTTESINSELSGLAKKILATATWQKDIGDWNKWLGENDQTRILKDLLEKLKDEKTELSERYLLAKQLRINVNVKALATNNELFAEAMKLLIDIAEDQDEDLELRNLSMKDVIVLHYHTDETIKKTASLIKELTWNYLNKGGYKNLFPFLLQGDKHIFDNPEMRKKLIEVLNDESTDIKIKAFVAMALDKSSKQKRKIAFAILEQCKKAKVFELSFEDKQARNIFNSSLHVLTGKDCSNDYDAWKKAISAMSGQ